MPEKRRVYLLDPQKYSPETIAVAFAKTSRSPLPFDEIADELNEIESAKFHEKWVVGYGHSSVAEHAVLHIATENISRLAVECLESNRLVSYTEKSTRYQKWDNTQFYIPEELKHQQLRELYIDTCKLLFDTYQQAINAIQPIIEEENPLKPGEKQTAWENRIRSKIIDTARFLLPAASLANVGTTINARALEYAIQKMLSHPLEEVRALGLEIKQEAESRVPTLIKYADSVSYFSEIKDSYQHLSQSIKTHGSNDWCTLLDYDKACEDKVLAAAIYQHSHMDFQSILSDIKKRSFTDKQDMAALLLTNRQKFDMPPRVLENAVFSFDLLMDQGAWFEFKRHRMMTQITQPLSIHNGYATPLQIVESGFLQSYQEAFTKVETAYDQLFEFNPDIASYIVPNAFNRRVQVTFNLRTAFHFLSLRTAANAHFSIRRICQRIAAEMKEILPLFGQYIPVNVEETWQQIEKEYFK